MPATPVSTLTLSELIDALDTRGYAIGSIRHGLASAEDTIARTQLALKRRTRFLWLDSDGHARNPLIDGKNDDDRKAQHAGICDADPTCRDLGRILDAERLQVRRLRAELSKENGRRTSLLEALATRRAELNARAAEVFSVVAPANGAKEPVRP